MIVSMTGFGYAQSQINQLSVTVEMKSVNHRFCEISIRMPRQLSIIEDKIKKVIGRYVGRGRIEVFITIEGEGLSTRSLHIDWPLVDRYYDALKHAKEKYSIKDEITLDQLFRVNDIISIDEEEIENEQLKEIVLEVIKNAATDLKQMRINEGEKLLTDITAYLKDIENCTNAIAELAPTVVEQFREKITRRVKEYINGVVEEDRLLAEVSLFAEKIDISEELTRIKSHIQQFLDTLRNVENQVVGRKLDFLVQEMNREINTIGAKGNDSAIARQVVEVKSLLEKIKEQVQNIE
jgi:uncharacterized protein (TIGR00255 family)